MPFGHVLHTLGSFAAGLVPTRPAARPLEIDLDGSQSIDPFAHAAIGTWITEDGAIRLHLKPDGRFDKAKGMVGAHRGRYEVDRSRLYFEDDTGRTALGALGRGVLSIGEKRFRKAAAISSRR